MAESVFYEIATGKSSAIFVSMVTCLSVWWIVTRWRERRNINLPPGPPSWPVVGTLPSMLKTPGFPGDNCFYNTLAQKYGSIYKLHIGSQLIFVVLNTDLIRAACTDSSIQDRPINAAYRKVFGRTADGLVLTNGKQWKDMRQFMMTLFRSLGVGDSAFEKRVHEEVNRLIEHLDSEAGKPVTSMSRYFYYAVSNIICWLTFGKQYNYDDPSFMDIVDILNTFSVAIGPSGLAITSPFLCALPFGPGKKLVNCMNRFQAFLGKIIRESINNPNPHQTPSNFVDSFLLQMKNGGGDPRSFTHENLLACSADLFIAGSDSNSATLSYAILFLATHPHVQEKCQTELDEVLADGKLPSYQEKAMLPYLQAVLLEVQRFGNIVPVAIVRMAHVETKLQGFDVPKGTVVLPNLTSIMMNAEIFQKPEEFNPDRFMKNGSFESHQSVIPFSIGGRACPGDKMSRIVLFTFVSRLLQRYSFSLPQGAAKPDIFTSGEPGHVRCPVPYSVVFVHRKHAKQ